MCVKEFNLSKRTGFYVALFLKMDCSTGIFEGFTDLLEILF